jgi:hypothetical protein
MKHLPDSELQFLEEVMVRRIDLFKYHKWKPGDTGYWAKWYYLASKPIIDTFTVTDVDGAGLLETDGYPSKLYPSDVSYDESASLAVLYFSLQDKKRKAKNSSETEEAISHVMQRTKELFFKQLLKKARDTK